MLAPIHSMSEEIDRNATGTLGSVGANGTFGSSAGTAGGAGGQGGLLTTTDPTTNVQAGVTLSGGTGGVGGNGSDASSSNDLAGGGAQGGKGGDGLLNDNLSARSLNISSSTVVSGGNGGAGGDGGAGGTGPSGSAGGSGGSAGASSLGGTGGSGVKGDQLTVTNSGQVAGGSGGAGSSGGRGGNGGDRSSIGTGNEGASAGTGGIGGIGFEGNASTLTNTATGTIIGGNGGVGGNGGTGGNGGFQSSTAWGGSGGRGGTGGVGGSAIAGSNLNIFNYGAISAGNGGAGGIGGNGGSGGFLANVTNGGNGNSGGAGGTGGIAIAGNTLSIENHGTISGGNGGIGGLGGLGGAGQGAFPAGSAGSANLGSVAGGAGIAGQDLSIINDGTISGGVSTDGSQRADAITFLGGVKNRLELWSNWAFEGIVNTSQALSATNTLALGGATNASFDVSSIVATPPATPTATYFAGFDEFEKVGTSEWTLTGTTNQATPWVITQGALAISSANNLGNNVGSVITFNGGSLHVTDTFDLSHQFAITNNGGTINTDAGKTATVTTAIVDATGQSGLLNKSGDGSLILTGDNTYSGGTEITAGTLQLGNGGTTGSLIGNIANSGTLAFNRSNELTMAGLISGTGAVEQNGNGATILTADNTYSGGTTISAGLLQLGAGGTTGSIVGDVLNNGKLAFNRSNTLGVPGVISGTGSVEQQGTGTTVLTAENTYTGGTTIGAGTLQLGDGGTTGSIVGDVTNDGTLAFNRSNSLSFLGAISGSGSVRQLGSGTTVFNKANTYSGETTIENGTLSAGATNVLSAASNTSVWAGSTLALNNFDQSVNALNSQGTIDFGSTPGTTLSVNGDYTANNSLLKMSTVLEGDNSPTDLLVVKGNSSGNSLLSVYNDNGTGALTSKGIKVVEVDGTSSGLFTLQSNYSQNNQSAIVAGAYAYKLYQDSGDGDWYLRSQAQPRVLAEQPPVTPTPGQPEVPTPTPTPTPPGGENVVTSQPLYQAGVAVYESYPQLLLALNSLQTLQQRVGNRYWDNHTEGAIKNAPVTEQNGFWGRVDGGHTHANPERSTASAHYNFDTFKMQLGYDHMLYENDDGSLIGGAGVHYTRGWADIYSPYDTDGGKGKILTKGYGLSGTLTWYGNNGFYVDGQAQGTWYDSDLSYNGGDRKLADNKGNGYALSVETGKRVPVNELWSVTPQAQLVYSSVNFDTFKDTFGSTVKLEDGDSLQARTGLAVNREESWLNNKGTTDRTVLYGIGNVYYEFLNETKVNVSDVNFTSHNDPLRVGAGVGGSINFNDDKYSLYSELLATTGVSNFGDSNAYTGRIGVRVKW